MWSRSGERCGREGVFQTETVVLLSPEEGESLVLCLKNPEEACVALLFPSYTRVWVLLLSPLGHL